MLLTVAVHPSQNRVVSHLPVSYNVSCGVQFGKVDATTYIMDYNPAEITAIQAFAISLSTFDTKLLL